LRFIFSSNLVGCTAGGSEGFSPLKDPADTDTCLRPCVWQIGAVADKGYRQQS
jgi:hypothetical protein